MRTRSRYASCSDSSRIPASPSSTSSSRLARSNRYLTAAAQLLTFYLLCVRFCVLNAVHGSGAHTASSTWRCSLLR